MWRSLQKLFYPSSRRTKHRQHSIDTPECRQLLAGVAATTSPPALSFDATWLPADRVTYEDSDRQVVVGDLRQGSTVMWIRAAQYDNSSLQITLSNNRRGVFAVEANNRLVIANDQSLRPGARVLVTVNVTTNGLTTSRKLELQIPDVTHQVETDENPTSGAIIGQLPREFRNAAVRIREVGENYGRQRGPVAPPGSITIQAFWYESFAGIPQPMQIGPRGQIVASPSTDSKAVIRETDARFDYEFAQNYATIGGASTNARWSGVSAYEARLASGRKVTLLVNLSLRDVKEPTEVTDQNAWYWQGNDVQFYTWPRDRTPAANQELRIIGGNLQQWFSVVDSGAARDDRFVLRLNDPEGLKAWLAQTDIAELDLIVELHENGVPIDTARVKITRLPYQLG